MNELKARPLSSEEETLLTETGVSPHHPERNSQSSAWIFWVIALTIVALDQGSKWWIRSTLPLGAGTEVWSGWMRFTHTLNFGAAWGVFSGQRWFLIAVSFLVIGFILYLAREFWSRGRVVSAGLGLILGGAAGNLIDRARRGAVTDFIDMDTPWHYLQTFPVFNLADAALTVGVVLLIGQWLYEQSRARPAPTAL